MNLRLLACWTVASCAITACVEGQPTLPRRDAGDAAASRPDVIVDDRPNPVDDRSMSMPDVIDDRPSMVAMDSGPEASVDAAVDARTDTGVPVDAAPDAAAPARCTPAIDGTISPAEYAAALRVTNTTLPSAWGPNELRDLYLCYDSNALYIALRGSVETAPMGSPANAIVVYIDRDYGSATGISLFSALNDRMGALDTALSSNFTLTAGAGSFGVEGAFGVAGLRTLSLMTSDETQGWRLFWPTSVVPDRRTNFAYVVSGVSTNCQDRAGTADDTCETSIAWTSLFEGPRPASTTIALFARIVNAAGTSSPDQTLPMDTPAMPRNVGRVLTLDVR